MIKYFFKEIKNAMEIKCKTLLLLQVPTPTIALAKNRQNPLAMAKFLFDNAVSIIH